MADRLLDAIRARSIPADEVRPAARWLITEGRDREAVKLGIVLLGLGAEPEDQQALRVLARHEEFTLYAGITIAGQTAQPDRELYALAKSVEGWGRIELVERLAATEDLSHPMIPAKRADRRPQEALCPPNR